MYILKTNPLKYLFPCLAAGAGLLPFVGINSSLASLPAIVETNSNAPSTNMINEAQSLIERVLPQHASSFICEWIPDEKGADVFEIEQRQGKIILRGNNGVSLASAFNWYLKYEALASYDWKAAGPLKIEEKLPLPANKTRQVCKAAERFFLNYCTYGYTFPYADFAEWQRFLDWMAMNGVNRPLIQGGQEAVWLNVWKSYGLPEEKILTYFTAPAHLAWHRMANIDQWGGPLPMSYIQGQQEIQEKLLRQARTLGMKPILSGFAGHVPEALKQIHPEAKITAIKSWGGFSKEHTWFLDPTDPLFNDIQKRFITEQKKLYGTDHLYAADPFNEIDPPSWDPDYMKSVAQSINEGMASGDPDAVWYQMGWAFGYDKRWLKKGPDGRMPLDGMTSAVPKGKLVFLDYVCEEYELYKTTQSFGHSPFIWNYLANFGGCTYQLAPLDNIAGKIKEAMKSPLCRGVGSTLEGISTYPVGYELTLEAPWHKDGAPDMEQWYRDYALRRAGRPDKAVEAGWAILIGDVLNKVQIGHYDRGSIAMKRPVLDKKIDPALPKTALEGTPPPRSPQVLEKMIHSARKLLEASLSAKKTDSYQYDLVNLTRQILSYELDNTCTALMDACKSGDKPEFKNQADRLKNMMLDMDTLTGTRHEFLIGSWIQKARSWGKTDEEKDYYEKNARQIVTTWGAPGAGLTDYARREWNGMIRDYYLPRWQEFISRLEESMKTGRKFDSKSFTLWCITHEGKWVDSKEGNYSTVPQGDSFALAAQILEKYFPQSS